MYKILLAEDDQSNQTIYNRMLTSAGYEIDIAENGLKAVEKAGNSAYDLILMDIQMPEMDGLEAAGIIRAQNKDIPIIAFTSLSSSAISQQCIDQGMNDFLNKPCGRDTLISYIEKWLKKRKVILIVDDMAESRRLLEHYLGETSYAVASANNGIEAIASFKKIDGISMILMDMEMPVMDGYTAVRTLRSLTGGEKIPVIAMTAHEGEKEADRCIKAGCTGYLNKPVSRDLLLQTIREQLKEVSPAQGTSHCRPDDTVVLIDPDIMELVPGYLENRRGDSEEISRLLSEGDLAAIRILGHSMAGSAGGYGIPEIGRIGKAIENAALSRNTEEIELLNRRLSEYLLTVTVAEKKP